MVDGSEVYEVGRHDRGGRGDSVSNDSRGTDPPRERWLSRPMRRTEITVEEAKRLTDR